jgi:hypothetical protein
VGHEPIIREAGTDAAVFAFRAMTRTARNAAGTRETVGALGGEEEEVGTMRTTMRTVRMVVAEREVITGWTGAFTPIQQWELERLKTLRRRRLGERMTH